MTKLLTQLTHAIGNFRVKTRVRVPRLEVTRSGNREVHPLVGDRYLVGRNPKECDIVVTTPLISQVHAELVRDSRNRSGRFFIRDHNSTNGVYRQKGFLRQRIQSSPLQHNTLVSLGPPELKESVSLRFIYPPPWYIRLGQVLAQLVLVVLLLLGLAIGIEWQRFAVRPLPVAEQGPIQILAGDQQDLAPPERATHTELTRLEDFGKALPLAVIVSEDASFYWNIGVDPVGVLRAIVTNLRTRQLREGASTITQQLARNLFRNSYVGAGDTPGRKWREAIVALKLTVNYPKDQILTLYLNRVYLGYGVYGFRDASLLYFAKEPKDLSLSEAATLAGILPSPERINPFRNKQRAIEYRDRVLQRLAELKKITWEESDRARRSVLKLNLKAQQELQGTAAPYFYGYIYDELYSLLGENFAKEGNLIVETQLNRAWQTAATQTLQNFVSREGPTYNFSQGAILTVDTRSGAILAMVGGVDFRKSQFDRVSQARRQPGSTFKLFAYGAALENGISPSTPFACSSYQGLEGCRSGGDSMDMYQGFAQSENVVAVRVAEAAGLPKVVKLARAMGITAPLEANANLVLGGYEVSMVEIAAAYATIAREGRFIPLHGIVRIWDSQECQTPQKTETCRLVYDADRDIPSTTVLSANTVSHLQDLMRGVVTGGTGRAAAIPSSQGIGKTGTTDNNRDLWYIGIAPEHHVLTAVWLGNDEGTTAGSSSLAAQVWGNLMGSILN